MARDEVATLQVGTTLHGSDGRRIGRVDAVFADYLLVRTAGMLPIDIYVPRPSIAAKDGGLSVDCGAQEAYARWHRPLKQAPHD